MSQCHDDFELLQDQLPAETADGHVDTGMADQCHDIYDEPATAEATVTAHRAR
jgi:hypothetical protein